MSVPTTRRMGTSGSELADAAALLLAGELVALPTETVYGLAARADDPGAIARLFVAKGRPSDNPLIVHVASMAALARVTAHVTPLAALLLERFAPGPLTVVLDAHPDLPRAVTAGLDSVAVRIPDHPVMLEVLRRCDVPLAAPSANRSGRPSPTNAMHVLDDLGGRIAAVVDDGPTRIGLESTVVDARGTAPIVLRAGAVSHEDLLRACSGVVPEGSWGDAATVRASEPRAPGTRHRHYAPDIPVHLARPGEGRTTAVAVLGTLRAAGTERPRIGLVTTGPGTAGRSEAPLDTTGPEADIEHLGAPIDASALARDLFAFLRRAEERGLDALVIEGVEEVDIGRAVMDRLRRAAEASGGSAS